MMPRFTIRATRLRYVQHWENKKSELDELMKSVSAANMDGFREDIDLYAEIRTLLPNLMDVLKDMNTLTPELHRKSGFSEIFDAIWNRSWNSWKNNTPAKKRAKAKSTP